MNSYNNQKSLLNKAIQEALELGTDHSRVELSRQTPGQTDDISVVGYSPEKPEISGTFIQRVKDGVESGKSAQQIAQDVNLPVSYVKVLTGLKEGRFGVLDILEAFPPPKKKGSPFLKKKKSPDGNDNNGGDKPTGNDKGNDKQVKQNDGDEDQDPKGSGKFGKDSGKSDDKKPGKFGNDKGDEGDKKPPFGKNGSDDGEQGDEDDAEDEGGDSDYGQDQNQGADDEEKDDGDEEGNIMPLEKAQDQVVVNPDLEDKNDDENDKDDDGPEDNKTKVFGGGKKSDLAKDNMDGQNTGEQKPGDDEVDKGGSEDEDDEKKVKGPVEPKNSKSRFLKKTKKQDEGEDESESEDDAGDGGKPNPFDKGDKSGGKKKPFEKDDSSDDNQDDSGDNEDQEKAPPKKGKFNFLKKKKKGDKPIKESYARRAYADREDYDSYVGKYIGRIKHPGKKSYAQAYHKYMSDGGQEPDHKKHGLSYMGAQAVRMNMADLASTYKMRNEEVEPLDEVQMSVPLFIRMLEFAKEDAKTDLDLHKATENILQLHNEGKIELSMDDYKKIVDLRSKHT